MENWWTRNDGTCNFISDCKNPGKSSINEFLNDYNYLFDEFDSLLESRNFWGIKNWGIQRVNDELIQYAITHNIKKIHKHTSVNVLKIVLSLIKQEKTKYRNVDINIIDKRNNTIKLEPRKLIVEKILSKLYSTITYNNKTVNYSDLIVKQSNNLVNSLLYGEKFKGFYLRWWGNLRQFMLRKMMSSKLVKNNYNNVS